MKKLYIIVCQEETGLEWSVREAYLDEGRCDQRVAELDRDFREHQRRAGACRRCTPGNEGAFLLRGECPHARIERDRFGDYCENYCGADGECPPHYAKRSVTLEDSL